MEDTKRDKRKREIRAILGDVMLESAWHVENKNESAEAKLNLIVAPDSFYKAELTVRKKDYFLTGKECSIRLSETDLLKLGRTLRVFMKSKDLAPLNFDVKIEYSIWGQKGEYQMRPWDLIWFLLDARWANILRITVERAK